MRQEHGPVWPPHLPLAEAGQALRRSALVALTVGAFAVGMAGDAAPRTTEASAPAPIVYNADGCVSPQPGDFTAVEQRADQPGQSNLLTADMMGAGKSSVDPHIAAEQYRQEVATKLGLHIYDATPILRQLEAEDASGDVPYTAYLTAAQQFMAPFGVTVRLASPDDKLDFKGKPLTAAELNSPAMKATLANLLQAYSNVPVEYVQLSGVHTIIFASNLAQNGDAAYYIPGTTVYDATLGISVQTYGHEFGHGVDYTLCQVSGMNKDAEFAAINGGNPQLYNGKEFNPDMPNFSDFAVQDTAAYTQALDLAAQGKVAAACTLIDAQNAQAARLTSWSEYHPNTAEGKAELYGELFDPETYVTMLDPRNVILRKQFIFLLARLHAADPALADYFLAVARRPIPELGSNGVCNAATFAGGTAVANAGVTDPTSGFSK